MQRAVAVERDADPVQVSELQPVLIGGVTEQPQPFLEAVVYPAGSSSCFPQGQCPWAGSSRREASAGA